MKLLFKILYNNRVSWIVFTATLLFSVIFFIFLPEQIPIHFDNDIVDSYAPQILAFSLSCYAAHFSAGF